MEEPWTEVEDGVRREVECWTGNERTSAPGRTVLTQTAAEGVWCIATLLLLCFIRPPTTRGPMYNSLLGGIADGHRMVELGRGRPCVAKGLWWDRENGRRGSAERS